MKAQQNTMERLSELKKKRKIQSAQVEKVAGNLTKLKSMSDSENRLNAMGKLGWKPLVNDPAYLNLSHAKKLIGAQDRRIYNIKETAFETVFNWTRFGIPEGTYGDNEGDIRSISYDAHKEIERLYNGFNSRTMRGEEYNFIRDSSPEELVDKVLSTDASYRTYKEEVISKEKELMERKQESIQKTPFIKRILNYLAA